MVEKLKRFKLSNLALLLMGLGYALRPVYLSNSGLPQLSDFFISFSAIILLVDKFLAPNSYILSNMQKYMALVLIYFVLVNTVSGLFFGSGNQVPYLIYSIFYLTIFLAYSSVDSDKVIRLLYIFGFLGLGVLAIQLQLGVQNSASPVRVSLGFNNPNQLGQYCLIISAIALYSGRKYGFSLMTAMQILLAAFFLVLSLSKAAIISLLVVFFLVFSTSRISLLVIGLLASIYFYLNINIFDVSQISLAVDRILSIGSQSDDSLEGRGYDYIVNYYQYLVFGAGEGFFREVGGEIEIHSLFGTILFHYGIFAFATYIILVFRLSMNKYNYIIFLPIMLFGITHNIIRDEVLWVLIAVFMSRTKLGEARNDFV